MSQIRAKFCTFGQQKNAKTYGLHLAAHLREELHPICQVFSDVLLVSCCHQSKLSMSWVIKAARLAMAINGLLLGDLILDLPEASNFDNLQQSSKSKSAKEWRTKKSRRFLHVLAIFIRLLHNLVQPPG